MPVLKDFRHTKTIAIPSYPDSQLTIYNSLLASETDALAVMQDKPSAKALLEVLPKFIREWNFTDEQNNTLPITPENLNLFAEEDLMHVIQEIKEFNDSLKKK